MAYQNLSIRELQAECKTRGLPTGTSRDVLVERLQEDDDKKVDSRPGEVKTEPILQSEPGAEVWITDQGDFAVAFRFTGSLTVDRNREFSRRAVRLAKRSGYAVIAGPGLVLDQGAHVRYVLKVEK